MNILQIMKFTDRLIYKYILKKYGMHGMNTDNIDLYWLMNCSMKNIVVILEEQQIERIFSQVKSVISVEYKNVIDMFNKKIRDIILYRTEWINNLSNNQDIFKYAFENESIDIKRNLIKDKIKSYEKALEILEY